MLRLILRQTNWGVIGALFGFSIGFFVKIYLIDIVGLHDWGKYATAQTFSSIFETILSIGIPFIIIKFIPSFVNENQEKASRISTIFIKYSLIVGVISFLFLETINYIEHYGLERKILPSGRYERVQLHHSWNSNHIIGRIVLYELTRHSDHHYSASKKYQILENQPVSPQLPYGYPTSILIALVPPIWFRLMNSRIPNK